MATLFSMLTLLCLLFFVKMLLLNVMVSSNIRACDLAKKWELSLKKLIELLIQDIQQKLILLQKHWMY